MATFKDKINYIPSLYEAHKYKSNHIIDDKPDSSYTPKIQEKKILLSFTQAKELVKKYLIDHKPQYLGTCVAHSYVNAVNFYVKKETGKTINLSIGDIYKDRLTKQTCIDCGMYPYQTFKRLYDKGVVVDDLIPNPKTINELKELDKIKDEIYQRYRIKFPLNIEYLSNNANDVFAYVYDRYKNGYIDVVQVSIKSYSGFWYSDVPVASGTINGGHSFLIITIPFEYENEPAVFAIDSAYIKTKLWKVAPGIRILKLSVLDYMMTNARKLIWNNNKKEIFQVNCTAQYGQNGDCVRQIQIAMIKLGYDIPAITSGQSNYGYYGKQTANAVMKFQLDNWIEFYKKDQFWDYNTLSALKGKYFGKLTKQIVNDKLKVL